MKKFYCVNCNREVSDYRVKRCRLCADKQHSLEMLGINNPAYKGEYNYCKCGKEISPLAKQCQKCYHLNIKLSGVLKGRKITWGIKISKTMKKKGISIGRTNPMFGKTTHSKYRKYKNIWFHSSWEISYVKYLNKNNIKWLYEPKAFDLGNCSYTPDFYLPEIDEYIEIKGFWRVDAIKKFKRFKKQYSQIKIKVLREKDLKLLKVI